jgi:hypothetical protein
LVKGRGKEIHEMVIKQGREYWVALREAFQKETEPYWKELDPVLYGPYWANFLV